MDKYQLQDKYCCHSFQWCLKVDGAIFIGFMDNKPYYYMIMLHNPFETIMDVQQLKGSQKVNYKGKCQSNKLILYFCPFCGKELLGKPAIQLD